MKDIATNFTTNMQPITILIRTHNRKAAFERCIQSIDYPCNVIVSYETPQDFDYIPAMFKKVKVTNDGSQYFYNNYCNDLKSHANGWFFFLDDDDTLFPGALEKLSKELINPDEVLICQFSRRGWLKPSDYMIMSKTLEEGQIGMPCLVMHSKNDRYNIQPTVNGDYLWINEVLTNLPSRWLYLPLVNSPQRNYGSPV